MTNEITSILNTIRELPAGWWMSIYAGGKSRRGIQLKTDDLSQLADYIERVEAMRELDETCFREIHHKTECGAKHLAEMMGKIRYTAGACIEAHEALKEDNDNAK